MHLQNISEFTSTLEQQINFTMQYTAAIPLPVVPLIQISPVHILLASYSLLQISLLNRAWFWAWEVQKGMSKWQSWHP